MDDHLDIILMVLDMVIMEVHGGDLNCFLFELL